MRIPAAIACAALVAAGCAQTPRVNVDPESGRVDVDVERVGTGETWNGSLHGMGSLTGLTGTTRVEVTDDMTHAVVTLNNAGSGTYPWHVHEGECGDNGPIVGDPSSYPLLRPGADGSASAEAHLSGIELNEAKHYYVNIHASPTDLGTIVGCGAIDD